ncbi:hypothetical protein Scep_013266 [Stephania cephalantha]|uniref:Uncharacterized protein n=1 Tax=Stephania cephalantha TaxID=152367 RepID=A0AAP0JGR7_9MAGN
MYSEPTLDEILACFALLCFDSQQVTRCDGFDGLVSLADSMSLVGSLLGFRGKGLKGEADPFERVIQRYVDGEADPFERLRGKKLSLGVQLSVLMFIFMVSCVVHGQPLVPGFCIFGMSFGNVLKKGSAIEQSLVCSLEDLFKGTTKKRKLCYWFR